MLNSFIPNVLPMSPFQFAVTAEPRQLTITIGSPFLAEAVENGFAHLPLPYEFGSGSENSGVSSEAATGSSSSSPLIVVEK